MNRTYLTSDPKTDRAVGYHFQDKKGVRVSDANYSTVRPSGAFLSTVEDMAKWDAMLYTDTILTPESKHLMWTPTPLTSGKPVAYGLGWFLETVQGKRRVSHGGSQVGFNAHYIHGIDDGVSVTVLTNSDVASPQLIAKEAARLYSR